MRDLLCFCCKSKDRKILENGEARINKKLDVIRLYKQLENLETAVKLLFTRNHRRIMKQSRRFTLDSQSSEHGLSGSDSLDDYETTRDTMTLGREERTEFLTSQIYIKRQFDSRKRRSSQ